MNNKPIRKHLRLPFYDYSQYGCYFVTICTHQRQLLFGEIENGKMHLNEIGELVHQALFSVLQEYTKSEIPYYVIMPNHLHFIWFNQDHVSLSFVVKIIKGRASFAYRQYNLKQNRPLLPLWQRGFYDHIIRDDRDYERVAEYIENNPIMWELDKLNPAFDENFPKTGGLKPAPTK
ncbi:transposase [Mannheimia granulomatis]|uniref:REP-associated tyrosine transposase n=1 Tax=Mannheimia granulomatis TaxID=85402 RepID=UPI00159DF2B5|nr:transposase [Mannheimia granulomatis]QLB15243.1 transposase [Mannheimia granulomatis]